MIKCYVNKEKAYMFTLDIEGDVQKYAMSFLHIFNNIRDNHDTFYRLENLSGTNKVFVTCDKGDRDEVRKYLSQFGEITCEEDVDRFIFSADYDSNGYDYFFDGDNEVQFDVEMD